MKSKTNGVILLMATTSLAGGSCAVNPVTGKKQVVLMSEAQELALGKQADPEIVAEYGLYSDDKIQQFINDRGQQMAQLSHRPNIPYTFRILDSDVINAFALPGGYVYFTRGIMAHFNDEAQFAGVLGHEIGHVTARHTVSQQTRATFSQIGLMAGMLISDRIAQLAEPASQGLQLMLLSYSRDAESQSDDLGVQYSSKAGYDARQMAGFFQTLQRQTENASGDRLPEFMSTHPDPGNRYQTVTRLAAKYQADNKLTNLKVNRDSYLRMISGLVYGEDPRQGFRENGVFYHPELRLQMRYPTGWQYKNAPTQVSFASPNGESILLMRLASGNSPQAAAQAFAEKNKLQPSAAGTVTVNGMPAYRIVANQTKQDQSGRVSTIQVLSYFIAYNNRIYQLTGISTANAAQSQGAALENYCRSFAPVSDQRIISIKPERIKLVTATGGQTLAQLLARQGLASTRHEEFAVLNGMQLTTVVPSGTLLKVVERR